MPRVITCLLPQRQGYRYIVQLNSFEVFGEIIWNVPYIYTSETRKKMIKSSKLWKREIKMIKICLEIQELWIFVCFFFFLQICIVFCNGVPSNTSRSAFYRTKCSSEPFILSNSITIYWPFFQHKQAFETVAFLNKNAENIPRCEIYSDITK